MPPDEPKAADSRQTQGDSSNPVQAIKASGWRRWVGRAGLATSGRTDASAGRLASPFAWIPFKWRVLLRWQLHRLAGSAMPPMPLARRPRPRDRQTAARGGANLLGYARGEFGVAECLRAYARALDQSGCPLDVFNFDVGAASREQHHEPDGHLSDALHYATNVFFLNADQMPIACHLLGRKALHGHHNVGFWLWELEKFPHAWRGAFDLVDEVWAPTAFVRDAIGAATRKPVLRMPMAIEFAAPLGMDRATFGLASDPCIFLFSFDFNGFRARKNPDAAIAAFRQAFGDGTPGVRLLLKTTNGARFPAQLEDLERGIADEPRIELRDGFLTRGEMFALQNSVDCYVSLHRSEGFGLGLAESMYLGKPVIATGYSGNMDFMDGENSLPVDYALVPLRAGEYPYWRAQRWADPDVAHAARLMRQVYDDHEFGRRIGGAAAASIRRTHSRAGCAAAVMRRLEEIDRGIS